MAQGTTRLVNDTVLNVAQLLKQPVGNVRQVEIQLDELWLDEDLLANDVAANLKLTRIETGLLVTGSICGRSQLVCVRCLEEFEYDYSGPVEAQYRPLIDIVSGLPSGPAEDDETFEIDEGHQLDLAELLRQVSILTMPIRPVCGEDCPGFESEFGEATSSVDDRLAVLQQLLDEPPDSR
jgi:uncharacterized protein